MTTPDDDPTAPVDLPLPGTPAPGTPVPPDAPGPPPPPAAGAHAAPRARAEPSARLPARGPAAASGPCPRRPAPAPRPRRLRLHPGPRVRRAARRRGRRSCCSRGSPTSASAATSWPLWLVVPGVACLVALVRAPAAPGARARDRRRHRHDGRADPVGPGDLRRLRDVGLRVGARRADRAGCRHAPLRRREGRRRAGARTGCGSTLVGLALFAGFALFFEGVIGLSGEPIAAFGEVLPFAVIGLGVLLVVASVAGGSRGKAAR